MSPWFWLILDLALAAALIREIRQSLELPEEWTRLASNNRATEGDHASDQESL